MESLGRESTLYTNSIMLVFRYVKLRKIGILDCCDMNSCPFYSSLVQDIFLRNIYIYDRDCQVAEIKYNAEHGGYSASLFI
jgi:hypothetical protein